jgi:hypothetical protein
MLYFEFLVVIFDCYLLYRYCRLIRDYCIDSQTIINKQEELYDDTDVVKIRSSSSVILREMEY